MRKLFRYMHGYELQCILGPLFKLLEAGFELFIPLVVVWIVDRGIALEDQAYIVRMCLLMVLLGVVGLICSITAQYFAARAAVGFVTNIRHGMMEHLLKLSYTEIDQLGTSTMVTRLTSDVNQIQNGVNLTLRLLLRSPFVVFGAMVMAFTIDAKAASVFVGVIPILCIIVFSIMLVTIPMYRSVQNKLDSVTSATRQNLTGIRVLRAFCKEESEIDNFCCQTNQLTEKQLSAGRISALMNPLTYMVINLAIVVLIKVGAIRVNGGLLSQGQIIALYNYMSQILVELIKLANLIISMTKAAACCNRVHHILNLKSSQKDGTEELDHPQGNVEFRNVTARYFNAGDDALRNINFSVQAGQTIGIIGGTGSGKSTLINLIPRFYDPERGQVLVDGTDVKTIRQENLSDMIGVVPQRAVLFRGTIRQNLQWGKENAEDSELMDALEIAQAKDVVDGREQGLDFMIEQGGANLSGGQRQRLTIARALIKHPKILILDDSASALDYGTDANLRRAIRGMKNAPTTFIVSQRAASVRFADQILVLDEGCLVGLGTHDQLLKDCTVYQEIYYSQFPGEVANHV